MYDENKSKFLIKAHNERSKVYQIIGKIKEAIEDYTMIIETYNFRHYDLFFRRGLLLYDARELEKAASKRCS